MKNRIAIFAHYDKDCVIDDYVVYYLQVLKKVCTKIIFVSCNDIQDTAKLASIADICITQPHKEYDFGSYKRGFLKAKGLGWIDNAEEIVFANDSCYGGLQDFEPIFESMNDCDFWGFTRNKFGYVKSFFGLYIAKRPHIQSYFLVFKRNVFTSKVFEEFITQIKEESSKKNIIELYEIGLSEKLIESGFRGDVYVKAFSHINNSPILKWRELIKNHNMPLLKCSLARLGNIRQTTVDDLLQVVSESSSYPVELISQNADRTMLREPSKKTLPVRIKRLYFSLISELPFVFRKIAGMIIVRVPFLHD